MALNKNYMSYDDIITSQNFSKCKPNYLYKQNNYKLNISLSISYIPILLNH